MQESQPVTVATQNVGPADEVVVVEVEVRRTRSWNAVAAEEVEEEEKVEKVADTDASLLNAAAAASADLRRRKASLTLKDLDDCK